MDRRTWRVTESDTTEITEHTTYYVPKTAKRMDLKCPHHTHKKQTM